MGISAAIISDQGGYFTTRPCGQIDDALNGNRTTVLKAYPDCAAYYSSEVPDRQVIVQADLSGNRAETAAALGLNFGAAGWLALALHAIGIEIYVSDACHKLESENANRFQSSPSHQPNTSVSETYLT